MDHYGIGERGNRTLISGWTIKKIMCVMSVIPVVLCTVAFVSTLLPEKKKYMKPYYGKVIIWLIKQLR